MNIKRLEKATKILEQVKKLDKEILEIEQIALKAANDQATFKLTLGVVEEREPKKEEDKDCEDHKIVLSWNPFGMMRHQLEQVDSKTKKTDYSQDIGNGTALNVLGFLVLEKQARRATLLKQLERMGVAV